jgi:hypothetical protein
MRAHLAAGDAAEALRAYERCRVLLAEEIGAIPSADLQAAYRDALGAERAGSPADGSAGPRSAPIAALPAPLAMAAQGLFCGREAELRELMTCWSRAKAGECRLVLVEGEPGVGKTRLAAEMARAVRGEGAVVLYGACDEAELISFQPFLDGLRAWMATATVQALEQVDPDVLSELSRLLPELANRLPLLRPPAPAGPDTERFRLFEAVRRWLAGLAEARPVLLVLDDLHWADGASVALLRHLVRDLESLGVLMLGIARTGDVRHDLLALETDARLPARWVVHAGLDDLSEQAVASLIARLLERKDPASLEVLADAIYQAAGGNAFFVTQLARHLAETLGLHTHAQAGLGTFVELDVPDSVKVAIGLRLARLSAAAREFVQLAAVMGREFDVAALALAADDEEAAAVGAMDEAVGAQLLAEDPERLDRYRFAHSLVRQVIYDGLSASRRARLHFRAGQALESRSAVDASARAAELAHQFGAAGRMGAEKAVEYATLAGRQAIAQVAWEDAVDHYELALSALDRCEADDPPRRRDLLMALGETCWRIGHVQRAKEVLRQAAAIAREVGSADELGRVALAFGGPFVNYSTIDDPELIGLLEDALAHPGLEEGALRARLSARLAEALSFAGGTERRVNIARHAIALARRLGDPGTLFFVLASCHWALGDPDSLEERLAMTAEAIELAERQGDRVGALEARFWHLSDLLEAGDLDGARAQQAQAFSLAQEMRQPYTLWLLSASAGLLALLAGDYGEAERLAGESMSYGLAAQNPNAIMVPSAMLFVVLRDRGRLAELEAAVTGFADEFPVMAALRCGLALLLAELGRLGEAQVVFEELAGHGFADIPRDATWLLSVAMLTEACAILGDKPRAALLYNLLRPYPERWATVVDTSFGSVARLLGLLASVLGRHDDAERHFAAATAEHRRSATLPWLARTHADHAAELIQRGRASDNDRAARLISQARAIAADLGMDHLLHRLDTLETRLS